MNIGKKRILSLDWGSTKLRVCDLHKSAHRFNLSYYDELECPPEIEDKESFFAEEGKAFIRRQPGKSFNVSLPGRGVLIRTLTIPKVPIKKVHDILKYEVQQQIPFPLEMVEWKYQILSETPQNFNVLLAAAKKELINDYLARVSSIGIDYIYLDTDLFAFLNSFVLSKSFNAGKCQAILELGANSSNLVIHHNEKILMRSLTTAGDAITNAIAESDSISFREAEDKKISEGLKIPEVAANLDNLNTEIQNSIDYWRFTQKGPEVEEFYLCGRSVMFDGFKEFFQEKSRIPSHYFDVFSNIDIDPNYGALKNNPAEFAVLTGIALRKNKQAFIALDMLPLEIERMKEFRQNRPYIYLSAVMAALIALTPTLFYNQDKAMLQGLLNEISVSLNQYERYKPEVDALNNEISALRGKQGVIKNVIQSKTIWLQRILSIGGSLPSSRIYISSIIPGETEFVSAIREVPVQEEYYEEEYYPDYYPEDDPGAPPPVRTPGHQPREVDISAEKVFTLNGEVVITDIRTAFSDFKKFVTEISALEFIDNTRINYCEVDQQEEKLEFSLVIYLK